MSDVADVHRITLTACGRLILHAHPAAEDVLDMIAGVALVREPPAADFHVRCAGERCPEIAAAWRAGDTRHLPAQLRRARR